MGAVAAPLAIASTVLSTGASVVGQIQQARAQESQARYQAAVARNNAIIQEQNAERARLAAERVRQQAEADVETQRGRIGQLEGRQRAALAANGVLLDQGSALDIVIDTATIGELDVQTIRRNAEREAIDIETQASNFDFQAQQLQQESEFRRRQASAASGGLGVGIFSTVLTGAGTVAGKWNTFRDQGAFG